MQVLTLQSRIHFRRSLVPVQYSLWCVILEGGQVMFQLSLRLVIRIASPEASWEGSHCRPSSVSACALPAVLWPEPQSNLQVAAAHTGLGGDSKSQALNRGQLLLVSGLRLMSQRYRTGQNQLMLVLVLWTLEIF